MRTKQLNMSCATIGREKRREKGGGEEKKMFIDYWNVSKKNFGVTKTFSKLCMSMIKQYVNVCIQQGGGWILCINILKSTLAWKKEKNTTKHINQLTPTKIICLNFPIQFRGNPHTLVHCVHISKSNFVFKFIKEPLFSQCSTWMRCAQTRCVVCQQFRV